jgi:hypothetical protein
MTDPTGGRAVLDALVDRTLRPAFDEHEINLVLLRVATGLTGMQAAGSPEMFSISELADTPEKVAALRSFAQEFSDVSRGRAAD